jgi:uncharacterized membrane protein affecting hemolysin expression
MKKKAVLILILVAMLVVSLTACHKISMSEKSMTERLEEAGYTIGEFATSMVPLLHDQASKLYVKKIMQATLDDKMVFVVFNNDTESADMVETLAKENTEYEVYRYEMVVMWGDLESISVARNY